jgi:hypothetical protein
MCMVFSSPNRSSRQVGSHRISREQFDTDHRPAIHANVSVAVRKASILGHLVRKMRRAVTDLSITTVAMAGRR